LADSNEIASCKIQTSCSLPVSGPCTCIAFMLFHKQYSLLDKYN